MSEMVERVARILCKESGRDPDFIWSDGKPEWTMYDSNARAAIEAMREPTPSMKSAGSDRWTDHDSPCGVCAGQIYTAMIGAALK